MSVQQIEQNVAEIMDLFRSVESDWEQLPLESIVQKIDRNSSVFTSVAYEAVSKLLAQKGIETNDLSEWKAFYDDYEDQYSSQLLIGLGWAIGISGYPSPSDFVIRFPKDKQQKIWDGIGYFYGLFRSRLTIRSRSLPEFASENIPEGFDAGIGRALYYHARGDFEKLTTLFSGFPEERKDELSQGIGTATVFVGGINDIEIKHLLQIISPFRDTFSKGVFNGIESRKNAGKTTPECQILEQELL